MSIAGERAGEKHKTCIPELDYTGNELQTSEMKANQIRSTPTENQCVYTVCRKDLH